MTTRTQDDPGPGPTCWCCGASYPETQLVRLGQHPEVGLCRACVEYLRRHTRRRDAGLLAGLGHDLGERVRATVIARGWHRRPGIGWVLRQLGRRSPW